MSLDVASSHFRNGEWRLAKIAADASLADDVSGDVHALLARLAARVGDPRAALLHGQSAVAAQFRPNTRGALGEALLANGEPFRARDELSSALEDASARESAILGTALSLACRAAGAPESGIAAAVRATAAAETCFGLASPEYAEALVASGLCNHAAGKEQRASELLHQAREVWSGLDARHPGLAGTLDALGAVARARNRPFEAVKLHREAIQVWTDALGEHAGVIAASRQLLAQALHRTGDFVGARTEMALSSTQTARCFGADHIDTWIARFELARFELDCGEVEVGLHGMVDAHQVVSERLGQEHPVVKAMKRWL